MRLGAASAAGPARAPASHEKQSVTMVMSPPEEILQETRRVVATMANGGLAVPEAFCSAEKEEALQESAAQICRDVHQSTVGQAFIKSYNVHKIKNIPGT